MPTFTIASLDRLRLPPGYLLAVVTSAAPETRYVVAVTIAEAKTLEAAGQLVAPVTLTGA